jgi:hypothetical protein
MASLGANPQLPESNQDLKWFKGNLRPLPVNDFTNRESLERIIEKYEAAGYDFLVLPEDVVDARQFKDDSLTFFPFTQLINDLDEDYNIELNAINIESPDSVLADEFYTDLFKNYLGIVERQGKNNVAYINAELFKSEDFYWIIKESDVRFIELYNGYAEESKVDRHFNDIEDVWDMINAERCREGRPLIYGLVNEKRFLPNNGSGHLLVHAKSTNPNDLFEAINAGHFYNSTGVVLEEVKYAHRELDRKIFPCVYVKIKPEPGVTYKIEVIQIGEGANVTSSVEDKTEDWFAVDNPTSDERQTLYSRIGVTSSKIISYEKSVPQFETAWTQPYIFH